MIHLKLFIPLYMLTTSFLSCICFNDNLKFKKIPFGNAAGEYALDEAHFPPEYSLTDVVYCNPSDLGRDSVYIISTCLLSSIYAWSLMSATGYTSSGFTTGYLWPIRSTPHGLLSSWSSCQDPMFTVRPVVLPGLHAWWCTIRDTGPIWEVGTTWASLAENLPCSTALEWHMDWSSLHTICMRNSWKAVVHLQVRCHNGKPGCHLDVTGRTGGGSQ